MALTGQSAQQGYSAIAQQAADFQQGEMLGLAGGIARTNPGDSGITLLTPYNLRARKIYSWIFAIPKTFTEGTPGNNGSVTGWLGVYIGATLVFYFNGTKVGGLPITFKTLPITYYCYNYPPIASPPADTVVLPNSVCSLAGSGGFTQDTLQVNLINPLTAVPPAGYGLSGTTVATSLFPAQPAALTLQPHYMTGTFDTVKVNIDSVQQAADIRLFLGIESNND